MNETLSFESGVTPPFNVPPPAGHLALVREVAVPEPEQADPDLSSEAENNA